MTRWSKSLSFACSFINTYASHYLTRLGFQREFVDLMMASVRSGKCKVRYNAQETNGFTPSRALSRGPFITIF
jgi:hypothetical protein